MSMRGEGMALAERMQMAFPPASSLLARAWRAGSAASLLSAAVLAWRGRRETGHAAAPIDAVSHWVHGPKAYRRNQLDLPHTALGFAVHHASSVFWGVLFAALLARRTGPAKTTGAALAVTALAAFTDLRAVPDRLSPGFQHRLRPASVAATYLAVACGFILAASEAPSPGSARRRGSRPAHLTRAP